ncbi:hypothetical protein ONZ45_g13458 [Pleurotus djamor]|nr:hypothetical protein ONZ45_g13458 [Pleurotus djamor]
MALPSLPNEILLDIFEYLPVEDLFNLDTTCKALRTACSSDALWRSASANVSLDIPLGKDLSNMKAGELRKLHSKAAKVEKVWKGDTFSLTHVFEVPVRDWVHHTQFLSSEILLTSVPIEEDGERKTVLDIWSLANRNPVLELQIVTDRLFPKGIAAAWRKYGEELMLTVLTDQR